MQIVIMSDGLKLFILFKICIAITILEFIPKTKTFRNFSTLSESPLHYFNNLSKPLFSLFQIAIDFSPVFHFQTLIFISFRPFIIRTFCLASNASDSFTSPSLIFPCPFSVSVSASSKLYQRLFQITFTFPNKPV